MKCHRCNGIMSIEKFYGPGDPFWGWRCLLCGEIADHLIFENRAQQSNDGRRKNDAEGK